MENGGYNTLNSGEQLLEKKNAFWKHKPWEVKKQDDFQGQERERAYRQNLVDEKCNSNEMNWTHCQSDAEGCYFISAS